MQETDFHCVSSLYKSLASVIGEVGEKEVVNLDIMSKPTVWRWKGSVNTETPDCNIVLSLLKKHSGLSKLDLIANKYDGHIKSFLMKSFPAAFEATARTIDKNASLLNDEYDFQIYFMCSNERGASLDEITLTLGKIASQKANISESQLSDELVRSMGSFAQPKVDRLIELKILEEKKGYLRCLDENTYISEEDGLKQSIQMLSNIINPSTWSTGKNVFYLSTETVEEETAKKASSMLKNAFLEVLKMLEDNRSNSITAKPYALCVAGENLIFEQSWTEKEIH
jgi:hypothetical protein